MEQNKRELLNEQISKIEDVLKCLESNFADCNIEDEINFLHTVKDSLEGLSR